MKLTISHFTRSWLAGWLLLMALGAQAAQVENLYTIEVAVPDQTTRVRLDAFKQAFRDVIVKVSGSEEALSNPGMKRPLRSSSRYVLQFRYVTRKKPAAEQDAMATANPPTLPVDAATPDGATDSDQLYLLVTFNQDSLENLLRSNNISIWGKQRPSTLLLIGYDVDRQARMIAGDNEPALVDEISALAEKRGLPVLFPLMDLEDRQQFSVQDVLNANMQAISMAAARYAPDALLVGQLSTRTGEDWQGRWLAQFSGKRFEWRYNNSEREKVLDQAMNQLARLLASEYALQSGGTTQQDVLFSVDRMNALQDHVRVLAYLKSLDAVASARLVLIDQDKVTYRVKLRNSSDDLSRLISFGSTLEQLDLPQIDASSDDQTILMNYRLLH